MNNPKTAIGYILDENGKYDNKHYFDDTPEAISNFIMQNYEKGNIIITDSLDNFKLNTIGYFIDRCFDQNYLHNELLPILVPLQMASGEIEELEKFNNEDFDSQISF